MLYNDQFLEMSSSIDGNNNVIDQDMNIDINMNSSNMMQNNNQMLDNMGENPIIEPVQERQIDRTFIHEVPQE